MTIIEKRKYHKPEIIELSSASGTMGMGSTSDMGPGVQKLNINPESNSDKSSPS